MKTQAFNLAPTTQGDAFIDNIRIGTTWADVMADAAPAPIPEPSSLALLALSGLCAFRRRR